MGSETKRHRGACVTMGVEHRFSALRENTGDTGQSPRHAPQPRAWPPPTRLQVLGWRCHAFCLSSSIAITPGGSSDLVGLGGRVKGLFTHVPCHG